MEVLKLFLSPSSETLDLKKKIREEFQLEFEILSNASKVQEGFMVSEYGKKDSGKVIFSLDELPPNVKYETPKGNLLEKLDSTQVEFSSPVSTKFPNEQLKQTIQLEVSSNNEEQQTSNDDTTTNDLRLKHLEEDVQLLRDSDKLSVEGIRLMEVESGSGKVIFLLRELPLHTRYVTNYGNRLERVSLTEVKLEDEVIEIKLPLRRQSLSVHPGQPPPVPAWIANLPLGGESSSVSSSPPGDNTSSLVRRGRSYTVSTVGAGSADGLFEASRVRRLASSPPRSPPQPNFLKRDESVKDADKEQNDTEKKTTNRRDSLNENHDDAKQDELRREASGDEKNTFRRRSSSEKEAGLHAKLDMVRRTSKDSSDSFLSDEPDADNKSTSSPGISRGRGVTSPERLMMSRSESYIEIAERELQEEQELKPPSEDPTEDQPSVSDVMILGTPCTSSVLSVKYNFFGGKEGDSTFQWERCKKGGEFVPIRGASDRQYYPTADDVNTEIRVTVTPVRDDWISGDAKTSSNSVIITLDAKVSEKVESNANKSSLKYELTGYTTQRGDRQRSHPALEKRILTIQKGKVKIAAGRKKVIQTEEFSDQLTVVCKDKQRFELANKQSPLVFTFEASSREERDIIVLTLRKKLADSVKE